MAEGGAELVLNLVYSQDGSITGMGTPVEIDRSQINSISLSRIFNVSYRLHYVSDSVLVKSVCHYIRLPFACQFLFLSLCYNYESLRQRSLQ